MALWNHRRVILVQHCKILSILWNVPLHMHTFLHRLVSYNLDISSRLISRIVIHIIRLRLFSLFNIMYYLNVSFWFSTCFIQSKQHGNVLWFGPSPSGSSVNISSPGLMSRAATIYLKYWIMLGFSETSWNLPKYNLVWHMSFYCIIIYLPTSGRNSTLKGQWLLLSWLAFSSPWLSSSASHSTSSGL